ncbi:MAG: radical SAM protein [Planctomycetota bacterium]
MLSETAAGTRLRTYVMKGLCREKALATYHLILAPTFECNLRCAHCYLPDHAPRGLSADRVLRLVDEWAEIVSAERAPYGGIFHLKGGEPLILPYFRNVLDRLAEHRTLHFMTTTNGVTGDSGMVARLDRLNAKLDGHVTVIVSIDGSREQINALLRGPGIFEPAIAFVGRLAEAGINVLLNNVVHRGNIADIDAFVDLALELDVAQVNFLSFVPKGFGEKVAFGRPDPVEVFDRIHAIWGRGDRRVRDILAGSLSDILHAESCGTCTSRECVGGYRGLLYIVPDGTAYSCPNLSHRSLEAGNILTSSLAGVHDELRSRVYAKVQTPEGAVQDRYLCKGERFVPLSSTFLKRDLAGLQRRFPVVQRGSGISYCYSRNF